MSAAKATAHWGGQSVKRREPGDWRKVEKGVSKETKTQTNAHPDVNLRPTRATHKGALMAARRYAKVTMIAAGAVQRGANA